MWTPTRSGRILRFLWTVDNKEEQTMKNFKSWIKAAGIRAIKTVAQSALSMISVGALLSDINWTMVASASAVAGIYSMLTSVAGLPELKE